MTTAPAFLRDLQRSALRRRYGSGAVERGIGYLEQGRVEAVHLTPMALIGTVRGSSRARYTCTIVYDPQLVPGDWIDSCTCPLTEGCKHVVATLLAAQDQFAAAPAAVVEPAPSWERALSQLLALAEPAPTPAATQASLGLCFIERPSYVVLGGDVRFTSSWGMVVLKKGRTGRWNKTPVAWGTALDARYDERLNPDHARAIEPVVRQLMPGTSDWNHRSSDTLLDDLTAQLWIDLRRAVDAGVELVHRTEAGIDRPARLAPPSTLALDLISDAFGGLLVRPVLQSEDDAARQVTGNVDPLGDPTHALITVADDGALTAVPFAQPPAAHLLPLLALPEPLQVPPADAARFLADYAPRLVRDLPVLSSDASVVPPAPLRPRVHISLRHPSLRELALTCGFVYGTEVVEPRLPHPLRDVEAERRAMQRLLADVPAANQLFAPISPPQLRPELTLRGPDVIDFVHDLLPSLLDHPDVQVEEATDAPQFRRLDAAPEVTVTVTDPRPEVEEAWSEGFPPRSAKEAARHEDDWFDLGIHVRIEGQDVPFGPLLDALGRKETSFILDSGAWFSLLTPALEPLRLIMRQADALTDVTSSATSSISRWNVGLWEQLVTSGVITEQSARWRSAVESALAWGERVDPPVPSTVRATLRPYQVDGFHWLSRLWDAGLGGILADDMGLGKTLQMLTLIAHLRETGSLTAPVLVVAPTSVVGAWTSEAAKFTPHLHVVAQTRTTRAARVPLAEAMAGADVVITSYTLLRIDGPSYRAVEWSLIVLDEAQFVKSHLAKTYQLIRMLRARMRVAITGTPLENSLMDLWSLLSLAAPGVFPDPETFKDQFQRPIEQVGNAERMDVLKRRIRPLMLRRTKDAVATELPPKQEQVVAVPLGDQHRRVYDLFVQRERQRLLNLLSDPDANRISILAGLTRVRQMSLDAALVDPEKYEDLGSAKLDLLVEHLTELAAEGHRALVFSQFTTYLKRARRRLTEAGIATSYLDGATRNRPQTISRFREGDATAFLISLKAGGFGLTLTEADYVYVLDPWWNPAAEAQAIDRTHRIGQTGTVMVYRLVSANTIEDKVVAMQERKRALFESIVGDDALASGALTAADLRSLLED